MAFKSFATAQKRSIAFLAMALNYALSLLLLAAASAGLAVAAAGSDVHACESQGHSPSRATILAPTAAGSYPVIVFLHGFMCSGDSTIYSSMLQDIAKTGYIVVAPQLKESITKTDATPQIHEAQKFIKWLQPGLGPFMSQHCTGLDSTIPNTKQLVAMGHSKGGKIAFALARGIESTIGSNFSAVIGIDPVDGTSGGSSVPPVLNGTHFQLPYPSLLVGSGLGPQRKLVVLPPCAPKKLGYMAFFNSSSAPVFAFSATRDGHMDFLDDNLKGLVRIMEGACKSGSHKRAKAVASQVTVAFLKAVFDGDCTELDNAIRGPSFVGKLGRLDCGGSAVE